MKEAYLYSKLDKKLDEKLDDGKVRCQLCAHRCAIRPGNRGICNVRENRDGILHTLVYDKLIAQNVDPIEKKPIFHMLPGSLSYSVATVGCNFKCLFCQNAGIAHMPSDGGMITGRKATPADVVADAKRSGCESIAYTYTEPTIYFEFAYETAKLAREAGIRNVWVSNGYLTPESLEMIGPYLDAANIDLKAFSDEFYKTYCAARLEPVKATLKAMKRRGILLEVTTLLIPDANDDPDELTALASFIADELGPETPWHISRFHPTYNLTDRSVTPVESLKSAYDIGVAAGLHYVYMGNVPGTGGEHTLCPSCGFKVIQRIGFQVRGNYVRDGKCMACGAEIYGVGMG